MSKKTMALLSIGVILLTFSACSAGPAGSGSTAASSVYASSQPDAAEPLLPQIETVTLDGESISGDAFAGERLTVLNIWGTWCPPCVAELPHLQEISEYYADQGVAIVGVMQDGVDEKLELVESTILDGKTLLADAGATYPIILPDAVIMREFISRMQYFPTTFFFDADGSLVETVVGAKDAKQWKEAIDGALARLS